MALSDRARVHMIVANWMNRTMSDNNWSAYEWARRAGVPITNITRVINPPEEMLQSGKPLIPNVLSLMRLAVISGTQPDLLAHMRRPLEEKPAATIKQVAARQPKRRLVA